jgi:hypothetical protein
VGHETRSPLRCCARYCLGRMIARHGGARAPCLSLYVHTRGAPPLRSAPLNPPLQLHHTPLSPRNARVAGAPNAWDYLGAASEICGQGPHSKPSALKLQRVVGDSEAHFPLIAVLISRHCAVKMFPPSSATPFGGHTVTEEGVCTDRFHSNILHARGCNIAFIQAPFCVQRTREWWDSICATRVALRQRLVLVWFD